MILQGGDIMRRKRSKRSSKRTSENNFKKGAMFMLIVLCLYGDILAEKKELIFIFLMYEFLAND